MDESDDIEDSEAVSAIRWLRREGLPDIARSIEDVESEWRAAGKRTRRNWWDILAGDQDGQPRSVAGRVFPVLEVARLRQGLPTIAAEQPPSTYIYPRAATPFTMDLSRVLSQDHAAPFLFVGSGVSRRYLGLPDWGGLLRRLAEMIHQDFNYYLSKANGDYPRLASLLAPDFLETWWKSDQFAESRALAGNKMERDADPLKYEIARLISSVSVAPPQEPALAAEFDALSHSVIDGVITTNWDTVLEDRFQSFQTYVGQESLLFSPTHGIGEIYKIHGCVSDFRSLVLTAEDYQDYNGRNSYLAAKLLTIFIEHPIVFLGYSLTDSNVQGILDSIATCLSPNQLNQLASRLLFVQWNPKAGNGSLGHHTIKTAGKNITVTKAEVATFTPVLEALRTVKRRYPASLLRRLKEHVYELVQTHDPAGQLFVEDIEKAPAGSKVEAVFGVGILQRLADRGLESFSLDDVVRNVVFGAPELPAARVVAKLLPNLLSKTNATNLPVFKFLAAATLLDKRGQPVAAVPTLVVDHARQVQRRLLPPKQYRKHARTVKELGSVAQVVAEYGETNAVYYLPLLPPEAIDVQQLKDYLQRNASLLTAHALLRGQYRKAVCLLDWISYGHPSRPAEAKS